MTDEPDTLVLQPSHRLDAKRSVEDLNDVAVRLAGVNPHIDRVESRLDRIERRLDLVALPH